MTQAIDELLGQASSHVVIEAALGILSDELEIEDPTEASATVANLAQPDGSISANDVAQLAQDAGADVDTLVQLLRLALNQAASTPEGAARVEAGLRNAGQRQFVIGPEWLALAALLVSGFVVHRTGGKRSETSSIAYTFEKGRVKEVRHETTVVYVEPFSGIGRLLNRLLPASKAAAEE